MEDRETLIARITKRYEDEQRGVIFDDGPYALPLSFESMSTDWLARVIFGADTDIKISGFRLGPTNDGSTNRRRVYLSYDNWEENAALPASVFCKASHNLATRFMFAFINAGYTEAVFYNKIKQYLDFETPEPIYAASDEASANSMIIMKDLEHDVNWCDEASILTLEQARQQVDILARLHAKFWENPVLDAKFFGMPTWPEYFRNVTRANIEDSSNRGIAAAAELIPERILARSSELWPAAVRSVEMHTGMPTTMLHADCHIKQWYVRRDNGRLGLADWQNVCYGNWGRDFAYAVTTSLTIDQRRLWEDDLLKAYLEGLKSRGIATPGFDEANDIYRKNLFSVFTYWAVTAAPPSDLPTMHVATATRALIERIATAIDDLDALDAFD